MLAAKLTESFLINQLTCERQCNTTCICVFAANFCRQYLFLRVACGVYRHFVNHTKGRMTNIFIVCVGSPLDTHKRHLTLKMNENHERKRILHRQCREGGSIAHNVINNVSDCAAN